MRRALVSAATALALLLQGCATDGVVRGQLHFGQADAPEGQRLLWPQPPDVPRYAYFGTLTGEQNFRRIDEGDRLKTFGRWLVGLDEQSPAPVVLQRPVVMIGDDRGRLYVGDTSRRAVFVFDGAAGELQVWEQASGLLNFVAPAGLAVSEAGRVWVADAELGAVFELDATGQPQGVIGRDVLRRPTGLARDAATGMLFVADTYDHNIKVFGPDGRLARVLGQRGEGEGEFNFPTHLALRAGQLYITDTLNSRIQVLDLLGNSGWRSFGQRGLYIGDLVRPKGVSVDGEGNVYVVESYYDSLLVFNPEGELLMSIGGTGTATGRFYLPAGVWVDAQNRVHVADMFNGRVVLFQFLGGG